MTGMSTLTTVVQHSTESPSLINQTTKINKRHTNWQRSRQTFTFADIIPYMENAKDSTKKLLELICEFSKVTGYKININQLHFYTPIMKQQKEKSRNQSHSKLHQNHKIPRNKSNQKGERSAC